MSTALSHGLRAFALLVLVLGALPARADLFSPGELSRPHAKLEGLSNCTKCHAKGQQLSAATCLSCHTELADPVREGKGFHGKPPTSEQQCQECHHEHQGRDFLLVDWGPRGKSGFEHSRVGFALTGKHAPLSCEKCHEPRRVQDPEVRKLLKQHPDRDTLLGLGTACDTCHFDEHRGQLGTKCADCHDTKGWKPAPKFDHGTTDYPLEGAHRKVGCVECHPAQTDTATAKDAFPAPRAATFARFEKTPHASCVDCHEDPHGGRFGERCESCHTVASFHEVRDAEKDRAFHDKTRYPLRGRHAEAPCKSCHGPFPGQPARFKNLAFSSCTSCHVDAHLGQLGAKGAECEQCHSVDGFSPARFGVEAHEKSRYPLLGAHLAVECAGCHRQEPSLSARIPAKAKAELARKKRPALFSLMLLDFPPKLERCETCHEDPHAHQFSGKKDGCTSCHQVESFHALGFQHDRDSRYPLTGRHASVACASCHPVERVKGREQVRYRPLETACATCHEDVHAGQLAPAPGQPTDCARCHDTAGFKETRFTHTRPFTDFALEGRHADVPCERCHLAVPVGGGVEVRRYKGLPRTCEGCHADAHDGAFQGFQP